MKVCRKCMVEWPETILSVDHINGNGRKEDVLGGSLYSRVVKELYPADKYQILCFNCNWIKYLSKKEMV